MRSPIRRREGFDYKAVLKIWWPSLYILQTLLVRALVEEKRCFARKQSVGIALDKM
jgi:hypothetical protein